MYTMKITHSRRCRRRFVAEQIVATRHIAAISLHEMKSTANQLKMQNNAILSAHTTHSMRTIRA